MMPEMNGMDLLIKIRENKFLKTVPVIFLSAKNTIDAQVQALEAGAEVFVIKPFKMELLKAQIKTLLVSRQRG
jgi:DNA-binding response OmpR family regulator